MTPEQIVANLASDICPHSPNDVLCLNCGWCLVAAIAAAVQAEREATARVAENQELRAHNPSDLNFRSGMEWMRQKIAHAIRARSGEGE